MTVEELRIGNLFFIHPIGEDKVIKVVSSIDTSNTIQPIKYNSNKEKCQLTQASRIQLNEEWLLRFGFEKPGAGRYEICFATDSDYITLRIMLHNHGWWKILECKDAGFNLGNINFVHQLQNLYFALTNQELKINEHAIK